MPVRVEIGPRDLAAGNCHAGTPGARDQGAGAARPRSAAAVAEALATDQRALLDQARDRQAARTTDVTTIGAAAEAAGSGWARMPWADLGEDGERSWPPTR